MSEQRGQSDVSTATDIEQDVQQAAGNAWGDDITPERQAWLEQRLQAWECSADHIERKGPFDARGVKIAYRLTGADVFWLAARTLAGADDAQAVAKQMERLRQLLHIFHEGSLSIPLDLHLDGLHLERADLEKAQLDGAVLRHSHLEGAHLNKAHLKGADLDNAHLEGAILLSGTHLEGAYLSETHLEGALLWGAHLERASAYHIHLEGADHGLV